MSADVLSPSSESLATQGTDPGRLQHAIEHAAHLLPSQGPITVFVHHNTLHAFEDRSFDEGVRAGGAVFGCEPYLTEDRYRQSLQSGRIRVADLEAVLLDDLGDEADHLVATFGTRYALRLAMLQFSLRSGPAPELRWTVAETDALRRFRDEVDHSTQLRTIEGTRAWAVSELRNGSPPAVLTDLAKSFGRRSLDTWDEHAWEAFTLHLLWRTCHDGVREVAPPAVSTSPPLRHRDALLATTGEDTDDLVHDVLIPLCAAFLDQGFADAALADRDSGMFRAFLNLYAQGFAPTEWLRAIRREAVRLVDGDVSPLDSIVESLGLLGVGEDELDDYVMQALLALRGWAGMIWQMETNAEWAPRPAPEGTLIEFLAVRLLLDRLAAEHVARHEISSNISVAEVRSQSQPAAPERLDDLIERRAFVVFQLAQVRGWQAKDLLNLSPGLWTTLVSEIEAFSSLHRRRVYHRAYERKYRNATLDAIAIHSTRRREQSASRRLTETVGPEFQLVCCIDDREESFRRHLEETNPRCETFGVAGFYGTAMYYRGAADAHFKPLCPVSIKPKHFVVEEPLYSLAEAERRRSEVRRQIGRVTHQAHVRSRTFLGGLLTTLAGSLAAFPLVARILFPGTTARIRQVIGQIVKPPTTQLRIERLDLEPGSENGQLGYSLDEMAGIVEGILRAIGLTQNWSRLVIFIGHGSTSLNNPHESAYNCGACSGSQGGPNARAFAQMANDFRVRRRLRDRGLEIPETTYFVGGYHDTTNESVTFADLDRVPVSHRPDFERALRAIDEARGRNAHERCRRFESADLSLSFSEALRHVKARPEDLSQARPEYNHATNALCFVGRREWSRGLFIDRRSFLSSYDPTQDDADGTILEGILRAAIPVCAGISLEYYFSTVDVEGLGCGSKLPHNITSLLGVMSGAASDLRPGLSAQMTEIHEPVRLLFVIETTTSAMQRIIDGNPGIARLTNGDWVQLAVLDASTSQIHRYCRGRFVPYEPESRDLATVNSSLEWYRGQRDHLAFVSIREQPEQQGA